MEKFNRIILNYLLSYDGVVQEYFLLKHLEEKHSEFFEILGVSPSLFKKHFWLFYHLYQIDHNLSEKKLRLIISPLEIKVCDLEHDHNIKDEVTKPIGEHDALRAFYTNKDNLELSEIELIDMQKKFWEKYLAIDKKANALKILGLESYPEINATIVKKRFNQLAQKHHPDKGGDETYFIQLRAAYEDLNALLR